MFRTTLAPALLAACCLVAGCKSGSLGPAKQYSQVDLQHGGTFTGTVSFTGKPPAPVQIDMAQDPVCAMSKDAMTEEVAVQNGGLANVVVAITSGLGNRLYPIPRDPVVMDQKGCRFRPHVAAAMVGQQVEFTNSDPTMHNVHMDPTAQGNAAFDVSQGPNASPDSRYFHAAEYMMPVRCNNHPWMHAYLNILDNPFFAVTDAAGHFSIKGLPPGTYTATAVHETLGRRTATFTVAADGTARQTISF